MRTESAKRNAQKCIDSAEHEKGSWHWRYIS
jgi:hypothetical protein